MKLTKKKDLKNLTAAELNTKAAELEKALFDAKMKKVTGQLADTALMWRIRKELARVKTFGSATRPGQQTAAKGK